MKKFLLYSILMVACMQFASAQTSYTWNGNTSTAFNVATNWTPNGVPSTNDNITIVTGSRTCILNAATSIKNITLTSGTFDLGGYPLTVGGTTATFTMGTVQNGMLTISGATTTTFGSSNVTMNCTVNVTSACITITKTTFQNALTLVKTGSSNDGSAGNNIFNGAVNMTNSGSGYLMMGNGNPDQFNASATFNNTGSSQIYVAYNSSNNIFAGATTFNNTPSNTSGIIYVGWLSANTSFNDNIVVTSTNGQGVQFCGGNNTATATLAANKTISVGAGGFSAGTLLLKQFTQSGSTAQNFALTGTGNLTFGPSSTFGGNVVASSPTLYMNGATFSGTTNLTKTGSTGDWGVGGNIFQGVSTITNTGSSYLLMGANNPDIWNNDVTFTNSGSERLLPAWSSVGNQFNGNIYVNTSGSAQGIQFCGGSNTATALLASGKTIQAGSGGLTAGYLYLKQFTQLGNAPINLVATGTAVLDIGPSSTFGGAFTATAPDIWAQGATYNGRATFNKTGGTSNHNQQSQNIFNASCTINQQSNTGYFMLGYNSNDLFNDSIIVSSTGNGGIYLGWQPGSTGTPTLAAGKSIYIGSAGFAVGSLNLGGFTQLGSSSGINLTLTGTSTFYIYKTTNPCVFNGVFKVTAPDIWVEGGTFNNRASFTKTGGSSNHNNQYQNIFNASCTINQQSNSGYFMLGYNSNDLFNDSIIVSSTGTGGIMLGYSSGNGTPTLASGKTITVGSAGFSAGSLNFGGFTQLGSSTGINLILTGTASIYFYKTTNPCVFNGAFNVTAPDIWVEGATFNAAATFTKTGGNSNHNNQQQNIFNASCTINQQSNTGYFMLGYNSNDLFNDSIIVNSTGTGGINLGWGSGTGTPTLATGKSIYVGSSGFSAGSLNLNTFTQLGNAPINLAFSGSTASLAIGRNSVIGGNLTTNTPSIYFNGGTFNGTVNVTKTGTTSDNSSGGNIFNGAVTITNSGAGYVLLGNGNLDQFNATATFNNTGSNQIYVGYNSSNNIFNGKATFNNTPTANTGIFVSWNSAGTIFNDNIEVTSTNGQGVQFCGASNATATLVANKTISVGTGGFSAGTLLLKQFTQSGSTAQNFALTGTGNLTFGPSSTFGGNVVASSPTLYMNGATFSGTTNLTKTGSTGDWGVGGNIFQGVSTITNTGSSYLLMGSTNPDIFNNDVTFTNSGSERLLPAWSSVGNQFNGNIYVNTSGSAQGIQFCGGSNTATALLASGKTIQAGSGGLTAGYLYLKQFTQLGNAPINLVATGTAVLDIGPSSTFGGAFTATAPDIWAQGATYNGRATFNKTGGTSNHNQQSQNIFNASCTINQQSNTGYFMLGYNSNDLFNDSIIVSSTGNGGIMLGNNSGNGTPTLASGKTIMVGSAGFSAGYLNLNTFKQLGNAPLNFTFTGTNASLSFARNTLIGGTLTATVPSIYFSGATFNGTVNVTKTGITNDNSSGNNIFNATTTMTNNGSGYILLGNGNADQFNASATFNNSGSSYIYVAYNSSNNIFASTVAFNNTPTNTSGAIYVSWYSTGTLFNNNIVVTSTNGQGVQFCGVSSATATLAATKTITVGAGGFSAGILSLKQFTQVGNTPQTFNLTGTAQLYFGSTARFDGDVVTTSPSILFNGGTFNRTVNAIKTGSTNDASPGGNTFNSTFTITNTGSGYFLMGNGNPDVFNATATFNNQSSGQHMYAAYNSTGNIFNGDVIFNNQPTSNGLWIYPNYSGINTQFNGNIIVNNVNGDGVYFGPGAGTATLASGKTISIGGSGFNSGGLIFRNFIQAGTTAQTLTTTGSSYIQFSSPNTIFNGAVTTTSPGLFFNGATFNGTLNSTKNGTTNDASTGANVFNAATTLTNTGTGYLLMTNSTADTYNSDVTFVQSSTGPVYPNYNNNSNYNGNLTITSPTATSITFGAGNGTATFAGALAQNIYATTGTPTPIFTRLVMNNTNGGVTLNSTSINVSTCLTMTSGLLNTTAANILTMLNGSTTAVGTALSTSYINGPMRYQKSSAGATTLNFPIGSTADCRPVALTVNHSNGTLYTYQAQIFNRSASALQYTLPSSVKNVSNVHHYIISRTDASNTAQPTQNLSGNQTIQLFFGANDGVTSGSDLTIVKNTYNAATTWINIGGTNAPAYNGGANLIGSVTSTSSPSAFNSFSTFALGNKTGGIDVLPITLLFFTAQKENEKSNLSWATATESNNDYFDIEKSNDGVDFTSIGKVKSQAANGNSRTTLNYSLQDINPSAGYNYYRLKQFNLDGTFEYSNIVALEFNGNSEEDEKIDLLNSSTSPALRITIPTSWNSSEYTLEIFNEAGQVIKEIENFTIDGGSSEVKDVDLGNMAHGLYIAVLSNVRQKRKKSYKILK